MELDLFPVVLVVDDDRGQVALVTSFLQKAGFRVVSAPSAEDALAALERAGATVVEYSGSEISVKGAGGPTCLTRPLVRAR